MDVLGNMKTTHVMNYITHSSTHIRYELYYPQVLHIHTYQQVILSLGAKSVVSHSNMVEEWDTVLQTPWSEATICEM